MNTIQWTDKATKQAMKIKDRAMRAKIFNDTQALAHFPDCGNVKKLTNHAYPYRLRVGNYRVFFTFDGAIHIITIEEVKPRNERTY